MSVSKKEKDNLELYNQVREVPAEAKKVISAGRLRGFTDVNPMWRIKAMTQAFGPCGIGWKYSIDRVWLESSPNVKEIACFVQVSMSIKDGMEWSEPIPGIGGSMFVATEKNGLRMSDECYKMALTDAISVACKALGVAADVYYDKDRTKYTQPEEEDKRSSLNPSYYGDNSLMQWLYDEGLKSKKAGIDFSVRTLIVSCYKVPQQDLQVIETNFENYIINNNLPTL